jgi:hypothetical protein
LSLKTTPIIKGLTSLQCGCSIVRYKADLCPHIGIDWNVPHVLPLEHYLLEEPNDLGGWANRISELLVVMLFTKRRGVEQVG